MSKKLEVDLNDLEFKSINKLSEGFFPETFLDDKIALKSIYDEEENPIESFSCLTSSFFLAVKYKNEEDHVSWIATYYFEDLKPAKQKYMRRKLFKLIKDPLDPKEYERAGFEVDFDEEFED